MGTTLPNTLQSVPNLKPVIKIDVVSDVVCPWCYIGKRRLETAIEKVSDRYQFEVSYHPFELNPDMPVSGVNQKQYLADKFGGEERYDQITDHTTQVAAQEGLSFDFSKQDISPNTRKAHIIIQGAKVEGKQLVVTEAFFKAYFTEGVDLSKDENLIAIAVRAGLVKKKVESWLADGSANFQVSVAEKELQKLGISGVPFYIINDRYGVSGAQASETFINAFSEIGAESIADGASCAVGEDCD